MTAGSNYMTLNCIADIGEKMTAASNYMTSFFSGSSVSSWYAPATKKKAEDTKVGPRGINTYIYRHLFILNMDIIHLRQEHTATFDCLEGVLVALSLCCGMGS